jgi:hypothetical protein
MLMTHVWHCIIQTHITKFNFWLPAESFSWKTNGFWTYPIENRTQCSLFLVNSIQEFRGHERIALRTSLQCRISDGVPNTRISSLIYVHKVDYINWAEIFLASWRFRNCPRTPLISWNSEFSRIFSQTTVCALRSSLWKVHLQLPSSPSLIAAFLQYIATCQTPSM